MSVTNSLQTRWTCPICGRSQEAEIRFQVGPCQGYEYHLGDTINWRWEGPIYHQRAKDGSVTAEGWTSCANDWSRKWQAELGLEQDHNWPPGDKELPPVEARKRIGCPKALRVLIDIAGDEIKSVHFSPNPEEQFCGEY